MRGWHGVSILSSLLVGILEPASAQGLIERVSVESGGLQANGGFSASGKLSADARFVAFYSEATNLVPRDRNGVADVFVRDRQKNLTSRVSVAWDGTEANQGAFGQYAISADGRFVAFVSNSDNLVPHDTNGTYDVFVRDRLRCQTTRVSVASDGTEGDLASDRYIALSADGRYVAFVSAANNLVASDTNDSYDAFVHDRRKRVTTRVSVASGGGQANFGGGDWGVAISGNGRFVAFTSFATDLGGDNGPPNDVFRHDRSTGKTVLVSVGGSGDPGQLFGASEPTMSADGQRIVFGSDTPNLVPGDTNETNDIFVRDLRARETNLVTYGPNGQQTNGGSGQAQISADGRFVAFYTEATNLIAGVATTQADVYRRDLQNHRLVRVNVGPGAVVATDSFSSADGISADGRTVAFSSTADNLVAGDTNDNPDAFVRALRP